MRWAALALLAPLLSQACHAPAEAPIQASNADDANESAVEQAMENSQNAVDDAIANDADDTGNALTVTREDDD